MNFRMKMSKPHFLIDEDDLRTEFARLNAAVSVRGELRGFMTVSDVAKELNKEPSDRDDFSTILLLLDWILAIPLTNVNVSRTRRKLIKTQLRTSLGSVTLGHLLQISINGPEIVKK